MRAYIFWKHRDTRYCERTFFVKIGGFYGTKERFRIGRFHFGWGKW